MANKQIPTALKILRNNPGKRPLPENEPILTVEIPSTPRGMSPLAKKHFPKIAKQLAAMKVMTIADTDALMTYCEAYAKWFRANEELKTCDWIVYSESGYPSQSPWLSISNQAFMQMKAMLIEFGMTPSSRAKVQVVPDDGGKKDPWGGI